MMELNVRVNGSLIANIYLHNEGRTNRRYPDLHQYYYEIYSVEKELKKGRVKHNRSNGWEPLVKLILEDVLKNE